MYSQVIINYITNLVINNIKYKLLFITTISYKDLELKEAKPLKLVRFINHIYNNIKIRTVY